MEPAGEDRPFGGGSLGKEQGGRQEPTEGLGHANPEAPSDPSRPRCPSPFPGTFYPVIPTGTVPYSVRLLAVSHSTPEVLGRNPLLPFAHHHLSCAQAIPIPKCLGFSGEDRGLPQPQGRPSEEDTSLAAPSARPTPRRPAAFEARRVCAQPRDESSAHGKLCVCRVEQMLLLPPANADPLPKGRLFLIWKK